MRKFINEIKNAVEPYGIECGWWVAITIKSGKSDEFVSPVKANGEEHPFSSCPLDPDFRKKFSENIALFAKIAKPAFILTEDDFSITALQGCFCKHHLEEFSKRLGKYYSREELLKIFSENTPESFAIMKEWYKLKKDTLVGLAEAMRKELDKESPEIPVGCNQPGRADYDGDATEAVARAMAGSRHTPFSRLYGAFYCGVDTKKIPEEMYHSLYSKQHITGEFKFYHESDTYPHTRFFNAAKHMKTLMAVAYSYGFDGSIFQSHQLFFDVPDEDSGYGKMFKKEQKRFSAVNKIAKQSTVVGVQIDYDPFWNTADTLSSTDNPLWAKCISRFGIPYSTLDSQVAFWDARQARYADDATVLKRLSKGLFLDGEAAKCLCERGYGEYLGVEVGDSETKNTNIIYDLDACEVIGEQFVTPGTGRYMPAAHAYAPPGNGEWLKLTITDENCEVITEARTGRNELITPAITRFENKLGGKIVVMSLTLDGNLSQALFNYRRQRLVQNLLVWCDDEFVFSKENPDIFIIENKAQNGNCDFKEMLTIVNLCEDEVDNVKIHIPKRLVANDFLVLNESGQWNKLSYSKVDDGIEILGEFKCCEPVYILIV